jgi:uncharacterized membrane protein HdeD (DUF308 family)
MKDLQEAAKAGGKSMTFFGVSAIILGMMIWRQFPLSGLWAVGILLGIKLFFIGLIMVTAGSAIRSIAKK